MDLLPDHPFTATPIDIDGDDHDGRGARRWWPSPTAGWATPRG